MSSSEKSKSCDAAHVSLFPSPPFQLVNKHQSNAQGSEPVVRPPTPPGSTVYRMFGNLYNADDAILRSLESQGVRRVYPQTYNRKRELRKLNFSILANYLDLLDIITRDPSSPKRTERLDNLAVLFINMHHLVNEYRQHQARDLLREILNYQVNIASETVEKAEQYFARADEILRNAGSDLTIPGHTSGSFSLPSISASCIDVVRAGLGEFGPALAPLLQTVLDETMGGESGLRRTQQRPAIVTTAPIVPPLSEHSFGNLSESGQDSGDFPEHLDPALWSFLTLGKEEEEMGHLESSMEFG
ncbi:unnamed protein product [Calicophoron daubneyi]|uniref:Mediator of RNA polymerase II transcription subunit 7 n=1 Tax=Calicophoron daubneyi TaxID=300641 RepID=A0AAV2T852_CALDB